MTETYNGPWSPVSGDVAERQTSEDVYHPVYPDASGSYGPNYSQNQPANALENTAVAVEVTS